MAGIFGAFSGFDMTSALKIVVWFFVFVMFSVGGVALAIFILVKKKSKKVIKINMLNRRMDIFSGRLKKKKGGNFQFFARKLKRSLPEFQKKSLFINRNQDAVVLLEDNKGLCHTARIPNYGELKKWYKVVYNIDIEKSKQDEINKLKDIYLLPAAHEDLDWLADQVLESEKEFSMNHWWQSPVVAYVATGFICFMMVCATIVLQNKLG